MAESSVGDTGWLDAHNRLASVVGAAGVIDDSTSLVMGAMIVSPLATPVYGLALATVVGSRRDVRHACLLLAAGLVASIVVGFGAHRHRSAPPVVGGSMPKANPQGVFHVSTRTRRI